MGARAPWLSLAMIFVSFVAALDILGTSLAFRSLGSWPDRLAGSVTVATGGRGLEGSDAAAARSVELLSHVQGVSRAWLLAPDPADAMAARIMGVANAGPDTAPPRLITAVFSDSALVSAKRVEALLFRARINAAVDDHGGWSGPLERAVRIAAAGAAALMLAAIGALFGLTVLGVRLGISRLRARVTLLIHLGARESEIAGPFTLRLALTAAVAAVLGAAAAAGLVAAVAGSTWYVAWLNRLGAAPPPLDGWIYGSAFAWCLAAWPAGLCAAALAARSSVRSLA
jgi:cell division protein FtsX